MFIGKMHYRSAIKKNPGDNEYEIIVQFNTRKIMRRIQKN